MKDLTVAWTWSLNSGNAAVNEFTPLVHDGVLFMWNFGETIQALDAKTGTLLWQYAHQLPSDYPTLPGFFRTKRSLAIGGNKLIVPTTDMRVIALDVKIGTKLWDVVTDDDKSLRTYNSGPLVSKDKVSSAPATARPDTRIAQADEPGGDTWNNLPNEKRGGGAIWVRGGRLRNARTNVPGELERLQVERQEPGRRLPHLSPAGVDNRQVIPVRRRTVAAPGAGVVSAVASRRGAVMGLKLRYNTCASNRARTRGH